MKKIQPDDNERKENKSFESDIPKLVGIRLLKYSRYLAIAISFLSLVPLSIELFTNFSDTQAKIFSKDRQLIEKLEEEVDNHQNQSRILKVTLAELLRESELQKLKIDSFLLNRSNDNDSVVNVTPNFNYQRQLSSLVKSIAETEKSIKKIATVVDSLDHRTKAIEGVILQDPQKAMSLILFEKDMRHQKDDTEKELVRLNSRVDIMIYTVAFAIFSFVAAVLAQVLSNLKVSKNIKPSNLQDDIKE